MLKTKLSDYKTATVEIYDEDGKPVTFEVRSMASREFRDAISEYREMMLHAKTNDIALEVEEEVDHGLGVVTTRKVPTEYANKAMAILLSSLVVEWPLKSDLKADLLENPEVGALIDETATALSTEFNSKKKK